MTQDDINILIEQLKDFVDPFEHETIEDVPLSQQELIYIIEALENKNG